jgi:hypothetical protein
MQIFVIDEDPIKSANLCDKHVVKQCLESVQILSTVSRLNGGDVGYKITHPHRKCIQWAGETLSNWQWLVDHTKELFNQWHLRYNHSEFDLHSSELVFNELIEFGKKPKNGKLTEFVFDVKEEVYNKYKSNSVVESYRNYYLGDKKRFAVWSSPAIPPDWFLEKLSTVEYLKAVGK